MSKRSVAAGIRHDAYFEIPVYPSAPNLLGFLIPFQVYRHTYKRASERSRRFYQRYPQHVQTGLFAYTRARGRDVPTCCKTIAR